MTQTRLRNAAIAIALAVIGAGVVTIIGLGTDLSATIQLVLVIVVIFCLAAATYTIAHIQLLPGQALVISGRKGPSVVRGSAFLSPLQDTCLVSLTPKWIEVSFDKPPYPLTLDGLPVTAMVRAKMAVDEKDEAVIAAAKILATKNENEFYEGGRKTLEGIVTKVLSETKYSNYTQTGRTQFEKAVLESWDQDLSTALVLSSICLIGPQQISIEKAELFGMDSARAMSAVNELTAEIAVKNATSVKKRTEAEADAFEAEETFKRFQQAQQHETIMIKRQQEDAIAEKNTQNELSKLESDRKFAEKKSSNEKEAIATAATNEKTCRNLAESKAETQRILKVAEANAALEVVKIQTDLERIRAEGELELKKKYVEVRDNELAMLNKNKDGDFRYQLAQQAISMSLEQTKALATALGNARIIGAIDDLPKLEKMIKTPIALREVIAEFLGVLDDELVQGFNRFFRGVAAARKATQQPDPTSSPVPTPFGMTESSASSPTPGASTSSGNESAPPIPNDRDFEN